MNPQSPVDQQRRKLSVHLAPLLLTKYISYVTELEDRMEKLEALLKQVKIHICLGALGYILPFCENLV